MTAYGIDEDWARLTPAELLAAGRTFAVGYVSEDTTGKNITRAEIDAYLAAGVDVLLVYEYSTTAVHGGAARGHRDAQIAIAGARAVGYPAGCAVAFAVDENTAPDPSIVDGYAGAFTADCRGAGYRSMVYGGLATVRRCADLGLVDLLWQTYAWSGGVWDPRVAIRQVQNGAMIAGRQVDLDTAMVDDFGQWKAGDMSNPYAADNADAHGWAQTQRQDTYSVHPGGTSPSPISVPNKQEALNKKLEHFLDNPPEPASVPVALTADQVAALGAQIGQHLDARLNELVALLARAVKAGADVLDPPPPAG